MRKDTRGDPGLNVGHWVGLVIGVVVLIIVVGALYLTLHNALYGYKLNETTFGPILFTLTPILIGVAILMAVVGAFLHYRK